MEAFRTIYADMLYFAQFTILSDTLRLQFGLTHLCHALVYIRIVEFYVAVKILFRELQKLGPESDRDRNKSQ